MNQSGGVHSTIDDVQQPGLRTVPGQAQAAYAATLGEARLQFVYVPDETTNSLHYRFVPLMHFSMYFHPRRDMELQLDNPSGFVLNPLCC